MHYSAVTYLMLTFVSASIVSSADQSILLPVTPFIYIPVTTYSFAPVKFPTKILTKARSVYLPQHFITQIRGGETVTNPKLSQQPIPPTLDMDRMRIRLDGLGQYAVICALLLNVCLNIYFNTVKCIDVDSSKAFTNHSSTVTDRLQIFLHHGMKFIQIVFMLSSITSIISSAYTAVIFTLEGLYSKAALGMGYDNDFLIFFSATQKLRDSAFQAFVLSLLSFKLSFFTSIMIIYKGQYRAVIITLTALSLMISWYHWARIMTIAGQLLYYSRHDAAL